MFTYQALHLLCFLFRYIYMSDAFREIDEEARQQRIFDLWRRYGNFVLALLLAVIVFTASVSIYRYLDKQQRLQDTEQLYSLLNDSNFPANISAENLNMKDGSQLLLLMQAAGQAYKTGDIEESISFYQDILMLNVPKQRPFQDLAVLMLARLNADGSDILLNNLAVDKTSIWQAQAILELAAAKGAVGEYQPALDLLSKLSLVEFVPSVILNQAKALEHVYDVPAKP